MTRPVGSQEPGRIGRPTAGDVESGVRIIWGPPLSATETREEHLALAAPRLLGTLCLIADKADFLRQHRYDLGDDVSDRWLADIETQAKSVAEQLSRMTRALAPDAGDLDG